MNFHQGQRVYDARTGQYLGQYLGPLGSEQARIQPAETWGSSAWTTPEKVIERRDITGKS